MTRRILPQSPSTYAPADGFSDGLDRLLTEELAQLDSSVAGGPEASGADAMWDRISSRFESAASAGPSWMAGSSDPTAPVDLDPTCDDVNRAMAASEHGQLLEFPADLAGHMGECSPCVRRWTWAARIDSELARLPEVVPSPRLEKALWARLDAWEQARRPWYHPGRWWPVWHGPARSLVPAMGFAVALIVVSASLVPAARDAEAADSAALVVRNVDQVLEHRMAAIKYRTVVQETTQLCSRYEWQSLTGEFRSYAATLRRRERGS